VSQDPRAVEEDARRITLLAVAEPAEAKEILSATLASALFPTGKPDIFMAYNKLEYQDTEHYKTSQVRLDKSVQLFAKTVTNNLHKEQY
jgi:hypothetical protein